MAKMSKTQREAILTAHERRGETIHRAWARPTTDVLIREGWALPTPFAVPEPTPAGLRAAGVDLDALHAEALAEGARRSEIIAETHRRLGALVRGAEPWSLDALPVVIEVHVEHMSECTERMEVSRAEWDAMTPAQRRDTIDTFGTETMNGQGGYGVSIVSGAPDSDLDDPPAPPTPAEARTGIPDRVAAALSELSAVGVLLESWDDHDRRPYAHAHLGRAVELLRAEVGR